MGKKGQKRKAAETEGETSAPAPTRLKTERVMECPVCLVGFGDAKKPLVLSCGHSICEGCSANLIQGRRISCPVCRANAPIPPTGLPVNYLVSQMADEGSCGMNVECRACSRDVAALQAWLCRRCPARLILCSRCVISGHRNHSVVELSELVEEKRTTMEGWQRTQGKERVNALIANLAPIQHKASLPPPHFHHTNYAARSLLTDLSRGPQRLMQQLQTAKAELLGVISMKNLIQTVVTGADPTSGMKTRISDYDTAVGSFARISEGMNEAVRAFADETARLREDMDAVFTAHNLRRPQDDEEEGELGEDEEERDRRSHSPDSNHSRRSRSSTPAQSTEEDDMDGSSVGTNDGLQLSDSSDQDERHEPPGYAHRDHQRHRYRGQRRRTPSNSGDSTGSEQTDVSDSDLSASTYERPSADSELEDSDTEEQQHHPLLMHPAPPRLASPGPPPSPQHRRPRRRRR